MKWICLLLFVALPFSAVADEGSRGFIGDAVERMLTTHPYRFALFRVAPKLILESGYDSNALSLSLTGEGDVVGDYYSSVAPGGSFAIKLGHRGFFMVDEDLDFLYYKDLKELRDIYNTTEGHFVTGSRKILLSLDGKYLKKKARVNSEFDVPSRVKETALGAEIAYAMRRRTTLNFSFNRDDYDYKPLQDVPTTQAPPASFMNTSYDAGVGQLLGRTITLTFDGGSGTTKFKDTGPAFLRSEVKFWNVAGGFDFKGRKLEGIATVGFERRQSREPDQPELRNLTLLVDLHYFSGKNLVAGVFANRKRQPSNFSAEGFRLTTEGGFKGRLPLASRYFVDGTLTIGQNQYTEVPIPITKDDYREADVGLNVILIKGMKNLVLRGGAIYYNRKSDFDVFNKNRTVFAMAIKYELDTGQYELTR